MGLFVHSMTEILAIKLAKVELIICIIVQPYCFRLIIFSELEDTVIELIPTLRQISMGM